MISKLQHREAKFFTKSICDMNLVIFPKSTQKILASFTQTNLQRQREKRNLTVSLEYLKYLLLFKSRYFH